MHEGFPLTKTYDRSATSVGEVRQLLREVYSQEELVVDLDLIVVLLSEVATNAVLHAGGSLYWVVLHAPEDGYVHMEVHDESRVLPKRRTPSGLDDHGRGLRLLSECAPGWSAELTLTGKAVHFTPRGEPCLV